jgi:uncharacterized protein with beta-barrel porin domain
LFADPYPPEIRNVGIFELRFYSGSPDEYNHVPNTSDYANVPFTSDEIETTVKYIGYWEQLIDPSRVNSGNKIVINITRNDSETIPTAVGGGNISGIINNGDRPSSTQTDGIIRIGGRFDIETVIHEFGHVVGFVGLGSHLVDVYGEKFTDTGGYAPDGIAITGAGTDHDQVFNLYEDAGAANYKYPMFLGRPNGAIEELIGSVHNADGSLDKSKLHILAQAAIQGTSTSPTGDFSVDLSHTGNMHSLMSYGTFINMPFMPEIELAMLEELGYSINRRKAFGRSYYNRSDDLYDGIVNGVGFDSDFLFSVGAHVFMDNLNLLQGANISSRGEGGAGIRIDGSKNKITIDKYTNIDASGERGRGLLAAWGSNNVIINRGNISANGEGGIGVLLDVQGGAHSYYQYTPPETVSETEARADAQRYQASQELADALIDRFDISGTISGKQDAILISGSAHVKEINIMNGAEIYGNIRSQYGSSTSLSFGKKADIDGNATNEIDPDFTFVLNNELQGQNQFDITTFAGITTIGENAVLRAKSATINTGSQFNIDSNYRTNDQNNKTYVQNFTLQSNATLGINTVYHEDDENVPFLNAGSITIDPNAKLDITSFKKGNYTVASTGSLSDIFGTILVAGKTPTNRHIINMNRVGNSIKLTLDANNTTLQWQGGNGTWDNRGIWDNNGSEDVFIDGDTVIFNKRSGVIDVPVSMEAQSLSFENGAQYRFTGAKIFVTDNLKITNAGTIARFNQNVQTQKLTVNNATLGIAANTVVSVKNNAEFNQATLEIGTEESTTSAGKISVAGKASVSGGIINVSGTQRRGAQYLFLEANELEIDPVVGGFVLGATADGRRGIVSYDTTIKKYWITVDGLLVDHNQNALTLNQRNLGGYLNALSPRVNAFNDMNSVLMTFENLSENSPLRYQQALDETAGNIYASAGAASIQNTTIANRTIATYLRRPPLSEVIPCYICRGVCQHLVNKPTSWVTAVGMGGTTQSDSNSHGYSQSSGGSIFGIDIMRRVGCHFGFYGSAMENVLTSKGIREHSRSHEFMGGFYCRADNSIGYLLFNNGYGFNQYKTSRTMSEFNNRKARSSNDSFNSTFYGELGTYYLDPIFRWHAYVGLQYAGVYQEAVRENGAGALNIIGDKVSTGSMRSFLGFRTERFERLFLNGMISGDFNFAWMHEYLGRIQTEFTGRFEGSPDSTLKYTVLGARTGRDWAIFGASIGYDYGRIRVFGGYDAYLNGDQSLHTGTLGTVYVW